MFEKRFGWILGLLAVTLVAIYFFFDPGENMYFPKCPVFALTGYRCAGCGAQRAVHHLLHLQVGQAFAQNPLLVASIPYLALGFALEWPPARLRFPALRQRFYGKTAAYLAFVLILAFMVWRNI